MPLKTVVKVGNISNLSDARYCSGMGVDMLGFQVVEGRENYMPPGLFQEIRGWVTGPKIVAEIYGVTSAAIQSIIDNYAPDYFELSASEFILLQSHLKLPCIVSGIGPLNSVAEFRLLQKSEIANYKGNEKVLIATNSSEDVLDLIQISNVSGIALNGSPELRPGFKDYNDLAEILEKLDEY
jgi:phosphoribosylanthranilate isomerase